MLRRTEHISRRSAADLARYMPFLGVSSLDLRPSTVLAVFLFVHCLVAEPVANRIAETEIFVRSVIGIEHAKLRRRLAAAIAFPENSTDWNEKSR